MERTNEFQALPRFSTGYISLQLIKSLSHIEEHSSLQANLTRERKDQFGIENHHLFRTRWLSVVSSMGPAIPYSKPRTVCDASHKEFFIDGELSFAHRKGSNDIPAWPRRLRIVFKGIGKNQLVSPNTLTK